MHISPLPDKITGKISTKFQQLNLVFEIPAFHWNLRLYCTTQPEVTQFKLEASKLQMMYLRFRTRNQLNSNGYTYMFGIRLFIGTEEITVRPNWKWKNPRWRPLNYTYMYIFAPRQDINEILTATPKLLWSYISAGLAQIQYNQTGSG